MSRMRYSLQDLQARFDAGDRRPLEMVIRAFRWICSELPADHPDSFFSIASFHGEPFRGPGAKDGSWWGGYCNHANILFPTWHRAYLLRLENAMRKAPECQEVTIPFWDECFDMDRPTATPIPRILTEKTVTLDGIEIPNPLFSYRLQKALEEKVEGANARYSKPEGYQTVRYPQSGLVGTEQDRMYTKLHNEVHSSAQANQEALNHNVANWLQGTVVIPPDGSDTKRPDTYSVYSRYKTCLNAPNYTVFSNTASQNQWIKDYGPKPDPDPHYVVSLESPHNAIHLAIGGFYQEGAYDADPIKGANGDMGDNETASFDPIFYFHHCFVDYTFWTWQKKNGCMQAGSIDIIDGYAGTIITEGLPGLPLGALLDMQTPLYPFRKSPQGPYYKSEDMVDIVNQLGYDYGPGSLDPYVIGPIKSVIGAPGMARISHMIRVHGINREDYSGSFVIRTFATTPSGKKFEIGREAVLSRWNVQACANCQNKLDTETIVPVDESILAVLKEGQETQPTYHAEIQTHFSGVSYAPGDIRITPVTGRPRGGARPLVLGSGGPLVEYL